MSVQPAVKKETLRIAAGTLILCVLMIAVYLIIGRFNYTVLLGALLGGGYSVVNFFLLGLTVQKASQKAEERMAENPPPFPKDEETKGEEAEEIEIDKEEKERNKAADPKVKAYVRTSYYLRLLLTAAVLIVGIALPCFDTIAVAISMVFPRLFILIDGAMLKRKAKET